MNPHDSPRRRKALLAKVHIAAKELGLDEDAYRDVLFVVTGRSSARDCEPVELAALLNHFRSRGWKGGSRPDRPRNLESGDRSPQLRKIEALLADAKRPWAYADGISKRMFGVDKVQFCLPPQLAAVIAALNYDKKRRENITLAPPEGEKHDDSK